MIATAFALAFASAVHSSLLAEVCDADAAADAAVASISTSEELAARQSEWRAWWLDALGECDGQRRYQIGRIWVVAK